MPLRKVRRIPTIGIVTKEEAKPVSRWTDEKSELPILYANNDRDTLVIQHKRLGTLAVHKELDAPKRVFAMRHTLSGTRILSMDSEEQLLKVGEKLWDRGSTALREETKEGLLSKIQFLKDWILSCYRANAYVELSNEE